MMRNNISFCGALICSFIFLSSCSSTKTANYHFNQKYPADKLREDFTVLKKILEANHPSLYWYTPKDSIDYYFKTAINSITDSLTETQFRNKVAFAVSKIRCGHTSVRFSKQYTKLAATHLFPAFPLSIKTWDDSMIVLSNAFIKDSILKRGTAITAINGKSVKTLTETMFQYISTDGFAVNFKSQVISGNFPSWYKNVFGLSSTNTVQYIDSNGQQQTTTIKNFIPKKDTAATKDSLIHQQPTIVKSTRRTKLLQKRVLTIDTTFNAAYIRLTTFSRAKLTKFFRQSFRTIDNNKIKNLIIDLRENGGGNVNNFVRLSKYVKDTAFKIGDTIAAVTRQLAYKKYITQSLPQWINLNFLTHKMDDERFHERCSEQHYFQPKRNHHFNGHIYIIIGGYSYSAATMFAGNMKGQQNVTLIGEETGGGYYGNTAMQIPEIVLPHTHLQVRLPLYRVVINTTRPKDGRGVLPDIPITPSSIAIKQGTDVKIVAIKKIIAGNTKP